MNPVTDKPKLRALAPEGWTYSGYWDSHYHYGKGQYKATGGEFYDMACLLEDLEPKNLAFMAKHGLTRVTNR